MMTNSDLQVLITKMHGMYGDRFPGLLPEMAKEWLGDLGHLDEAMVDKGLRRWMRQHTFKAPSLDELLEQIECARDEGGAARRQGSSDKGWKEVLNDAAETQATNPERSEDEVTYGRLMAALATRSIEPWFDSKGQQHPKLTMEQRGQQCCLWARKYEAQRPQLATDLRYAAVNHFGIPMALTMSTTANDPEHKDLPHA